MVMSCVISYYNNIDMASLQYVTLGILHHAAVPVT